MATLLLKNVPEALRDRLKARAELHRRSMNQEALVLLEMLLPPPIDPKMIASWKPLATAKDVDWVRLVRESRDEAENRGLAAYPELVQPPVPMAREGKRAPKRRRR